MLPDTVLKYVKDADLAVTAINCSPSYSEKKGRVTKGDTKAFVGWNKQKKFSKKFIQSTPFSTAPAECFMADISTSDLFVIDIDVTNNNNAKDSLRDGLYDYFLSRCKYAIKTGSGGVK